SGNYIGLNAAGTGALGNSVGVYAQSTQNFIGTNGDGIGDASEGNVIAGNSGQGILLYGSNNVVAGNIIGLDISGNVRSNGTGVAAWLSGSGTRIGTNADGTSDSLERNVISGNSTGIYPGNTTSGTI